MAFEKFITLSLADYTTLSTTGTVTIGGTTLTYQPNDVLYLVPDSTQSAYRHEIVAHGNGSDINFAFISFSQTAITTSALLASNNSKFKLSAGYMGDGNVVPYECIVGEFNSNNDTLTYLSSQVADWTLFTVLSISDTVTLL